MFKQVLLFTLVASCYGNAINHPKTGSPFLDVRIIGGSDAKITDFPYQVELTNDVYSHRCGGAIIADTAVLTTIQCTEAFKPYDMRVLCGSNKIGGGIKHEVVEIREHPKYEFHWRDYDVAIVIVAKPFNFTETTQKIEVGNEEPADGLVTFTGWGVNVTGNGFLNPLQKVTVPVVPREECVAAWELYDDITARMFCGGVTGQGPCWGDGGDPVVQNGKVVGLVSKGWGFGCAKEGFPGVFTNVANDEIQQFIIDNLPKP